MTDKERKEIFNHRADHRLMHETLMSYTGFKCALADAERRFTESIQPAPSDQGDAWDVVEGIIGRCTCDIAYVSRQMTDPNCSWCDYHVYLITAMRQFAANETAHLRAEVERVRWEKELVMRQLSAANQRVVELSESVRPVVVLPSEKEIIRRSFEIWPVVESAYHERIRTRYRDNFRNNCNLCMDRLKELNPDLTFTEQVPHGLEPELPAPCPKCGGKMQIVRPGEWQCDTCGY